ncbi:hypothetical protein BDP27DRAFT_1396791 [Rhodocollybia butyracea]|uniref:Uncharacterized protein n=1 Tax=Rhodocollybia butyracea TaxID=206335 RepID=A0A9P5QAA7_9AGAR|nr:hypothetical protein BDP27DRAFT_1396791 [Rhodocollybia butyracea]
MTEPPSSWPVITFIFFSRNYQRFTREISIEKGGSDSSTKSAETLIDELHGILKELPTEQPPGSEDIYKLDTSIFWGSDDLQCTGIMVDRAGSMVSLGFRYLTFPPLSPSNIRTKSSSVQPTAEQKAQFKRAVEIFDALVDEAK